MTSAEEISKMFDDESQKLVSLFKELDSRTDVNIHQIVEGYYQVMNVSTMISMLKQQADSEPKELADKITNTEKLISEKFDSVIHPKILEYLTVSVQELTKTLQSASPGEKSREQTEMDAKLFEELRQNMSTKEFVEQYEKGLSHD